MHTQRPIVDVPDVPIDLIQGARIRGLIMHRDLNKDHAYSLIFAFLKDCFTTAHNAELSKKQRADACLEFDRTFDALKSQAMLDVTGTGHMRLTTEFLRFQTQELLKLASSAASAHGSMRQAPPPPPRLALALRPFVNNAKALSSRAAALGFSVRRMAAMDTLLAATRDDAPTTPTRTVYREPPPAPNPRSSLQKQDWPTPGS